MLGLHLVWCLWLNQKPIIFQDAREGLERLIKGLKNRQSAMECFRYIVGPLCVTKFHLKWFAKANAPHLRSVQDKSYHSF